MQSIENNEKEWKEVVVYKSLINCTNEVTTRDGKTSHIENSQNPM